MVFPQLDIKMPKSMELTLESELRSEATEGVPELVVKDCLADVVRVLEASLDLIQ